MMESNDRHPDHVFGTCRTARSGRWNCEVGISLLAVNGTLMLEHSTTRLLATELDALGNVMEAQRCIATIARLWQAEQRWD